MFPDAERAAGVRAGMHDRVAAPHHALCFTPGSLLHAFRSVRPYQSRTSDPVHPSLSTGKFRRWARTAAQRAEGRPASNTSCGSRLSTWQAPAVLSGRSFTEVRRIAASRGVIAVCNDSAFERMYTRAASFWRLLDYRFR
jgi:hypothetical protein